jgi:hypothetical protein
MEERWLLNDLTRERKRQKIRNDHLVNATELSSGALLKIIFKNDEREERWRIEDTIRLRKRIEYRKIHKISDKEDRRWKALTRGI